MSWLERFIRFPKVNVSRSSGVPATLIVPSVPPVAFFLFFDGDEDHEYLEFSGTPLPVFTEVLLGGGTQALFPQF